MNRTRALAALSALAIVALVTGTAAARTGANPAGRLILDPNGATERPAARPAAATSAQAAQFVNVPLADGAVLVDSTYYDLQDMGSLGHRIVVGPDGRVHVTWQDEFCELGGGCPPNLAAPNPHPNRGMGYAWRDATNTWHVQSKVTDPDLPVCCIRDLVGGFGALGVAPDGRAIVAQHLNEDGCDLRAEFHLQESVGGTAWQGYIPLVTSFSPLFPQIAFGTGTRMTMVGEIPRGGGYDEVQAVYAGSVPGPTTNYSCFVWQIPTWNAVAPASLFNNGEGAFPSVSSSSNGRVGVAMGDFGGNVWLIESSDGTFAPATMVYRKLTNYSDAAITAPDSTSTQFRPYLHCGLAYNDTTPNVVWSEFQARRIGGVVSYADHRSRIMHWDPVRGIEVVKQVQPGEADSYDNVDNGFNGPLAGFNTLSVDWPQVGFSEDGSETYVVWLKFRDDQVDPTANAELPGIVTGIGFGDIACSMTRTGEPWSAEQNVTNTPMTDERYVSLATRNPGGKLHLVYQSAITNEAGTAIIGDRGTNAPNVLRRIAYLERRVNASAVSAPAPVVASGPGGVLGAAPNPARGGVWFSWNGGRGDAADLSIHTVDGRRVAQLSVRSGGSVRWEGVDRFGRPVPTGMYFAKIEGAPASSATRFLWLR